LGIGVLLLTGAKEVNENDKYVLNKSHIVRETMNTVLKFDFANE
jgi:hypothetical protein